MKLRKNINWLRIWNEEIKEPITKREYILTISSVEYGDDRVKVTSF